MKLKKMKVKLFVLAIISTLMISMIYIQIINIPTVYAGPCYCKEDDGDTCNCFGGHFVDCDEGNIFNSDCESSEFVPDDPSDPGDP